MEMGVKNADEEVYKVFPSDRYSNHVKVSNC